MSHYLTKIPLNSAYGNPERNRFALFRELIEATPMAMATAAVVRNAEEGGKASDLPITRQPAYLAEVEAMRQAFLAAPAMKPIVAPLAARKAAGPTP